MRRPRLILLAVSLLCLTLGACTDYAYRFAWIGDGNEKASDEGRSMSDKTYISGYLND